jgi:hypothetical protein
MLASGGPVTEELPQLPIPYFGPGQTDAFIPALVWFLVATALAVIPVVLGPLLGRMRLGRVLTITPFALAFAAAIPGVLQVGQAFTVLGDEHALVQRTMTEDYGVPVSQGDAASLLEGGRIRPAGYAHTIHLAQTAPGQYEPVEGTVGRLAPR